MGHKKSFGKFFGTIELLELSKGDESYLEAYADSLENFDTIEAKYHDFDK